MTENSVTQFRSHRKCVTDGTKKKKNADSIAVTDHRTRASLETEKNAREEKNSDKKKVGKMMIPFE